VLALFGWFIANRNARQNNMGGGADTTHREVGTVSTWHAPDYSSLNLTPGSPADNIAKAITAGDWSKSIDLEGLNFEPDGAISESAKPKLKEVASVLAATPGVRARITGYGETDEAGQKRADSIKSALDSAGVASDRISTRGQTGSGMPTVNLMRR